MCKTFFLSFLAFILVLLFCVPLITAYTSQAMMQVDDFSPQIRFILTEISGNDLKIRINADDANGYEDIEEVKVKIVLFDGEEKEYLFFGSESRQAAFVSGKGASALYEYNFTVDGPGSYRIKAAVTDGKNSVEDFRAVEVKDNSGTPTGFFAAVNSEGGSGLILRLFSWVKGWFS